MPTFLRRALENEPINKPVFYDYKIFGCDPERNYNFKKRP